MVPGVSGALFTTNGHLGTVIAVPGGRLCGAGIGQGVVLGRHSGDSRPVDAPCYLLLLRCSVVPLIPFLRLKRGDVGTCIGSLYHTAKFQGFRVEGVPRWTLNAAVIGQGAILGRNGVNGERQIRNFIKHFVQCFLDIGGIRLRFLVVVADVGCDTGRLRARSAAANID